ncbi:hypothetical protein DAMA08_015580 [Martiniozyma asiatica (nom. inval.)]|nr:hypothetical protein DAMA08_015580 [Martiniozyma asiatica]
MEKLKEVTAKNLTSIRHSLLGLVGSYSDSEFVKQLIQLCELENIPIDLEQLERESKEGVINLFHIKNKLPLDLQSKFDDILDEISEARERVLENSTLEAAKLK